MSTSEADKKMPWHYFIEETTSTINRLSIDAKIGVPDYLLAEYLWTCLRDFDKTLQTLRHKHPGSRPTGSWHDD